MEKNNQFKKNFIWNILGTGVNAFISLFFMIAIVRINDVNTAGIYTIAYSTACILYMIGIYAGRVYQVTENNKDITDKDYILNRIISCFIIFIISIVFVLIRGYDIYKASVFIILGLFKGLEAFSEVFYGILQKNDLLEKAGKSSFVKSVLSVIIFILVDFITKNLIISFILVLVSQVLVILFYDLPNINKLIDKTKRARIKNVINIFKYGFLPFAISFLGVYMSNVQKYAIDSYLSEDVQAIFGIVIMPATVMGLFVQFLIHPYLNQIFELHKANKYNDIKKIIFKIILVILGLGVICSIARICFRCASFRIYLWVRFVKVFCIIIDNFSCSYILYYGWNYFSDFNCNEIYSSTVYCIYSNIYI